MRIAFILMATTLCFFSCKSKDKKGSMESTYLPDQIEVDLADKMHPDRIVASFPPYKLRHLCTLDKEKNIVVFGFDPMAKNLKEMLAFLDGEVGIEAVSKTEGCPSEN